MSDPAPTSPKVLPSYKKPPVNEVVIGMRFAHSNKLFIPHIGFLWDKFRAEYPKIQHAPPIATKGDLLTDISSGMPYPRVWFINNSDDQLVQFQIDRFYFNWRRKQEEYPRYHHVINKFENALDTVVNFFEKLELGEFQPLEFELSYINHIPKGEGWNTMDDISKIFSVFHWNQISGRFLPNPSKFTWKAEFPLGAEKGNLTIDLKEAIRITDKVPLLVLNLKAIGVAKSNSKSDILGWYDIAHEWIVEGFTDITTPEIQKVWEREK